MISPDDDILLARDELERALYTLPRNDPASDILRRMIHEAIELSSSVVLGNLVPVGTRWNLVTDEPERSHTGSDPSLGRF